MTLPQVQRGFSPSISPLDSTSTAQLHAGLTQCHRSPDFISMALFLSSQKTTAGQQSARGHSRARPRPVLLLSAALRHPWAGPRPCRPAGPRGEQFLSQSRFLLRRMQLAEGRKRRRRFSAHPLSPVPLNLCRTRRTPERPRSARRRRAPPHSRPARRRDQQPTKILTSQRSTGGAPQFSPARLP